MNRNQRLRRACGFTVEIPAVRYCSSMASETHLYWCNYACEHRCRHSGAEPGREQWKRATPFSWTSSPRLRFLLLLVGGIAAVP